jgi:transposase
MTKRKNKTYTTEFKQEAVALVTEQGYSVSEAAASLEITTKLIYNWKAKLEEQQAGESLKLLRMAGASSKAYNGQRATSLSQNQSAV